MSGVTEDRPVACHAAARRFDPAFKLFGSTIPVSSLRDCKTMTDEKMKEEESVVVFVEDSYTRSCSQVVGDDAPESELGSSSGSNDGCDEVKRNSGIERTAAPVPSVEFEAPVNCGDTQKCLDDDHGDATQGKVRKKPGKPVPCPRCDSLDTKFCYYNNYNVNQPRHFCKNCQRYWTAGGSLRNVPVGAGRRKNKHSTTAFPDGLVARDDEPDAADQLFSCSESSFVGVNRQMKVLTPPSRLHALPLDVSSLAASDGPSSSVILNFGQESLLCESIGATSSNVHRSELLHELGRVSGKVCVRAERDSCSSGLLEAESNLLYEKQIQLQDDRSCAADMSNEADATIGLQPFGKPSIRSTVTAQPVEPLSVESKMDSTIRTELPTNANTSLGWVPGGPFAFVSGQWQHVGNIGWSTIALPAMATDLNPSSNIISANHPQSKASVNHPPWSVALGSPWVGIPGSVIQNPTWGPHACSGAWAVPWAPAAAAAAATTNPICGSSTLGKHHREQEEPEDEKQGSLWVPKSLRIHDLEEAGRSSIWTTLVLGNKTESLRSGGIFRAFQPKAECIESDYPHVQARHSNPAALTRSMAFQECILTSQDADAQGPDRARIPPSRQEKGKVASEKKVSI